MTNLSEKPKIISDADTDTHSVTSCNLSIKFADAINRMFYGLGYMVASHPFKTVSLTVVVTLIFASGCVKFHKEKNPLKLWIPQDSKFLRDTEWLMKSFEEGTRTQSVLITAPDVLEPRILKKLAQISKEIHSLSAEHHNGTRLGWTDVCFQIPNIAELTAEDARRRRRRSIDGTSDNTLTIANENRTVEPNGTQVTKHRGRPLTKPEFRPFSPSVDLASFIFCGVVDKLPTGCLLNNILELWDFDDEKLDTMTKDDILDRIAQTNISSTTGHEQAFDRLLGGIKRNSTGHIVAATGLLSHWMVYVNFSDVNHDKIGNAAGTEDWASEEALAWENGFLEAMHKLRDNLTDAQTEIFFSAGRSYGDISAATMFQDMNKIVFGSFLMFIFMLLVLSKFGWVQLRLLLCSMGLACVGMSFLSAMGFCSMIGISYGPVHTSLPFLLMGLGIDDIFVMMACWQKVQSEHKTPRDPRSMPDRMGLMLQMAGSSITITSFTDVVAFVIGSITILPSLESFCLYAAIGVFFIYIYVTTFVVAIFTIDEHRILANRNALVPCLAHKAQPKLWCDAKLMNRLVKWLYTNFILTNFGKFVVLMITIAVTGYSTIGLFRLEQKFDPNWFIPERTYLSKYIAVKQDLYPDQGYEAMVLMGRLNYTQELIHIADMVDAIENRTDLVHEINAWIIPFREFIYTFHDQDFYQEDLSDYDFRTYLSEFLLSKSGGKYHANFRFASKLVCGEPVPDIVVSTIEFRYRRFSDRTNYVRAMHTMEDLVNDAGLKSGEGFAAVWGRIYGNWITDEIIDTEVQRNIMLALGCVMVCTTILIMHPQICFWIFTCVVLTLINVCGFMESWGLTIDLVSCIGLELAAGLCVDYAAHVGHTFLVTGPGTRTERALETIQHIGPAVLYGGGSTLLAVSMLANSEAYTFQCFFKIFLLVIIFGLFFGLIFLPVILSLIGPSDWHDSNSDYKITPSDDDTKRTKSAYSQNNKELDNDKEMISFMPRKNDNGIDGDVEKCSNDIQHG